MLTIGKLGEAAGVKVPTIRYYEQIGLLPECRVAPKWGHPQFVCHGLAELRRLKGSGRGIEEALGTHQQRAGRKRPPD